MSRSQASLFSLLFFLFASVALAVSEAPLLPEVKTYEQLVSAIRKARSASQARIEAAVEQEKVREAWEIGKLIDEHVLQHKERANYGERVIIKLANDLGISETELKYMLQFARTYSIRPPADELSWAHYRELLSLNDPKEREEVTTRAAKDRWTRNQVREEVRKRQNAGATHASPLLPEITPGPLYTYQIVRLKDRLKIDLGFGLFHNLPEKYARKFKEGDIVAVVGARSPRPFTQGGETSPLHMVKDTSPANLFTYSAIVTSVVDGDTLHALIDLGFEMTLAQRVRLRRIDTPDLLTAEGKEAKAYLEKILSRDNGRILLRSRELDQHGRPIADVWVQGKPVDQELLDKDLAVKISE